MSEIPSTDYIELLTMDDDGNPIEGPRFPRDLGVAEYLDVEAGAEDHDVKLAYPHKFFRYDENRQPMPETLVEFLVPEHLLENLRPTHSTLALVARRMGWETGGRS